MTVNRNIPRDQAATRALCLLPWEEAEPLCHQVPTWLDHTQKCAQVDYLLMRGARMAELVAARPSAKQHIHHLQVAHGLEVKQYGDFLRFRTPSEEDETSNHETQDEARLADTGHITEPQTPVRSTTRPEAAVEPVPALAAHARTAAAIDTAIPHPAYGLVSRATGSAGRTSVRVVDSAALAVDLLREPALDTLFVIGGPDPAGVQTACLAVSQIWNVWLNSLGSAQGGNEAGTALQVRSRGDWMRQDIQGEFYCYEYRDEMQRPFYVGKGTRNRHLGHLTEVRRMLTAQLPAVSYSAKERAIAAGLLSGHGDSLVRQVCAFDGPHAELCAYAVENFLIVTGYGPFALRNDTVGNMYHGTGLGRYHWLCKPTIALESEQRDPIWRDVAGRSIASGRAWQTQIEELTWMSIEPYVGQITELITDGGRRPLQFLGGGAKALEWNILGTPARLQLIWSRTNPTLHLNLRPAVPGWRQAPTVRMAREFKAWINTKFDVRGIDVQALIRMAGASDCYFKPFGMGGGARADTWFSYAEPDQYTQVRLPWLRGVDQLNLPEALSRLFDCLSR